MPSSDDHVHAGDLHGHPAAAHHEAILAEPETPGWLPAIGGCLFAVLALGWLATRASAPTLSELTPPPAVSAAAPPSPEPAPAPTPEPQAAPAPAPAPAPALAVKPAGKAKAKPKPKAR